jgi:hypothetical protein
MKKKSKGFFPVKYVEPLPNWADKAVEAMAADINKRILAMCMNLATNASTNKVKNETEEDRMA